VNRSKVFWIGCSLYLLAAPILSAQNHFCACMIGKEPILKDVGNTVYAYDLSTAIPERTKEYLFAVASAAFTVPGEAVRFDVSKTAVLMQCRFLQSAGVAALGKKTDFSPLVAKDLLPILLSKAGTVEYYLFFNKFHPKASEYAISTERALKTMKDSGTLDSIGLHYGIVPVSVQRDGDDGDHP